MIERFWLIKRLRSDRTPHWHYTKSGFRGDSASLFHQDFLGLSSLFLRCLVGPENGWHNTPVTDQKPERKASRKLTSWKLSHPTCFSRGLLPILKFGDASPILACPGTGLRKTTMIKATHLSTWGPTWGYNCDTLS